MSKLSYLTQFIEKLTLKCLSSSNRVAEMALTMISLCLLMSRETRVDSRLVVGASGGRTSTRMLRESLRDL